MQITDQQAIDLAKKLHVRLNLQDNNYNNGLPLSDWKYGIEVELEHGTMYGNDTNVTKNDLLTTARIALAHIKEFPNYYPYLKKMEEKLEKEWESKNKPCIVNCPGSNNSKVTSQLLGAKMTWTIGGRRKYRSEVQSILVPKNTFKSKKDAVMWVKKHKQFKMNKVDTTKNYYRFRQKSPGNYKEFRTIMLDPKKRIKAVVGLKPRK